MAQGLTFELASGFPADASFFDGHFPGRPIVPAAVLLAEAARLLAGRGLDLVAVDRVKFMRPVSPGEPLRIELTPAGDGAALSWVGVQGPVARARVTLSGTGS